MRTDMAITDEELSAELGRQLDIMSEARAVEVRLWHTTSDTQSGRWSHYN